jgi:hypothetical protein
MTSLAKPLKNASGLRDMRSDWRRWSATERWCAMTMLATVIALLTGMLLVGNPT